MNLNKSTLIAGAISCAVLAYLLPESRDVFKSSGIVILWIGLSVKP